MGWSVFVIWECRLTEDTGALLDFLTRLRTRS